ncbi:hypothetical protein EDC65_1973 [Stella humosa]|uniref:Uncharacterized protein n=1 Tax=Stella humosa TaxID=94 RepID=A0A3N1MBU7_9PROT|nr:hypothetical protein [Stella humosa]ROQ00177.1 hypothetical protein EDC65_1973 [Stella humosa]BBK30588.1 hypothetical protein STHU_12220 [Stella humosa]
MTDVVLEILIDPTGAEAGAARAVRALDDIRAGALAAEGGVGDLGRSLGEGGDGIARSLDAAARSLSAFERAAAVPGGAGLLDGLLVGGNRAASGFLGILNRLAGDVGRMFGAGGSLDFTRLFDDVGRAAATGLAAILPAGLGFLSPIASLAGGALGGFLGSLFKKKPKVPQGEYSVWLSDPDTAQHASTAFPTVTDAAQGVTTDLTRMVLALEQQFAVRRSTDPGAAIGATLNQKEGLRLFYDAGAGDGPDAAGRAWFQADPENAAAVEAARQGFAVALLKDSDWSAWGQDLGRRIATHLAGSTAETVDELMADAGFIAGFEDAVARLNLGIGDFAQSMATAAEAAGRADAQALATRIGGFLDKTQELGLPLDRATDGMRAMVETMAGLRDAAADEPLSRLEEGTRRLTAEWQAMAPILERLGYGAAEAAGLIETGLARAIADLAADLPGERAAFVDRTAATLGGRDYVPTGDALFAALGLDPAATPDFFAAIRSALAAGATGGLSRSDAEALMPRFANQYDRRLIGPDALEAIAAAIDAAVTDAAPARAVGVVDDGARRAAEDAILALGALEAEQREAARAAARLADALGTAAAGLGRFRAGLLTGPASPLAPGDQLAEARRQEADALRRLLAGGEDAPQAARDLQQVATRVQELARTVHGSSAQSVAIFAASLQRLQAGEGAAAAAAGVEAGLARAANAELTRIAEEVAGLRADLRQPAGQPAAAPTFGVAHLGRAADEATGTFMARRFPDYQGAVTDAGALAWLDAPHASGLGLTRRQYFASATAAGYGGAFGGGGHEAFLSPGGNPDMNRWIAFIDQLRRQATVPFGHFGIPYAAGGLVTGGIPGRDSVPILAMPGERVLSVEQARLVEGLAANQNHAGMASSLEALRATAARADASQRQEAARLEARFAMLERGLAAMARELGGLRTDLRIAVADRPAVGAATGSGRR